jgi:tubulin polyglutamylase TTLL1/tubulin monoglycylase TTLL3/8
MVHLTNDAIQKHGENYGKYENGNKLSYDEIETYIYKLSKKIDKTKPISFMNNILPQMKFIATQAVKSTYRILDGARKEHNFELFGLDFMINDSFEPFLIEVNTNPCLELSCPLLSRLIP